MTVRAAASLIGMADRLWTLQAEDGSIGSDHDVVWRLLESMADQLLDRDIARHQPELGSAFRADARAWRNLGLDSPPCFDRVRAAIRAPSQDEPFVFAGPVETPNGAVPGRGRIHAFYAIRDEPRSVRALQQQLPHPGAGCQNMRLRLASAGYMDGNCIVFFDENIQASGERGHQGVAMFFMNKFEPIYRLRTIPYTRAVFDVAALASEGLHPRRAYDARCAWAYLHDTFHHISPRPIDTHTAIKTRFATGALEELRVDAQVVLHLHEHECPEADVITEMVLFERIIRYPRHPRALNTFDSATGLLLFEWLERNGALEPTPDGAKLRLVREHLFAALASLVATIEGFEILADDLYVKAAQAFVATHLPAGSPGHRFGWPEAYRRLLDILPVDHPINFRCEQLW